MTRFRITGPGADTGEIYLECQAPKCWWHVEVDGWSLDSINEVAAEHDAEVHP